MVDILQVNLNTLSNVTTRKGVEEQNPLVSSYHDQTIKQCCMGKSRYKSNSHHTNRWSIQNKTTLGKDFYSSTQIQLNLNDVSRNINLQFETRGRCYTYKEGTFFGYTAQMAINRNLDGQHTAFKIPKHG